jgi:hypothetical protein
LKKFILKLSVFVAIQAVILAFVTSYGSMDAGSNEYMYSLKDKYDLLLETPSPRIIFVGGSNLAFGLMSGQLKAETGLNPVNMGVHGRLGIHSMIRMVKEQLRPSDVVVVSPEYSAMFVDPECSREIAIEAFRVWPGCKRFIQPDIDQPLESLVHQTSPLRQLGRCVVRARLRLESSWSTGDGNQVPTECYRRKSFNQFGDHIAHYQAEPTYRETGGLAFMDDNVFERVADELNQFAALCRNRGAKLYFLHPPIPLAKVSNHVDQIRHMDQMLANGLSFPRLSNLDMATLADHQFFDGQSHLNESGAKLRTAYVCQQIRQFERIAVRSREATVK